MMSCSCPSNALLQLRKQYKLMMMIMRRTFGCACAHVGYATALRSSTNFPQKKKQKHALTRAHTAQKKTNYIKTAVCNRWRRAVHQHHQNTTQNVLLKTGMCSRKFACGACDWPTTAQSKILAPHGLHRLLIIVSTHVM